ncbi:MAG: transporter substrate-binding domain-containing protein [Alphaproteobacteria bacterium]|jgi:polar amino acid transport system substrate-binding protein|nr:transporter substrate-binding domain-containing protein [Alphaproteobacteria bacterium]
MGSKIVLRLGLVVASNIGFLTPNTVWADTLTFSHNGLLCPIVCDSPEGSRNGYVLDILSEIAAKYETKVKFQILPKTRLARELKKSDTDILLLPSVPLKKYGFAATKLPIVYYSMAVMRRKNFPFKFTGLDSLKKVKWGVVSGEKWRGKYQAHIEENKGISVVEIFGSKAYDRASELIARKRIDVVISVFQMLDLKRKNSRFAEDVTVDRTNVFGNRVPIHAAFKNNDFGKLWANRIDSGLRELRKSGRLKQIFSKYDVGDEAGISAADVEKAFN